MQRANNIIKLSFLVFCLSCTSVLSAAEDPSILVQEAAEGVLRILDSDSPNSEEEILSYLSEFYNLDIIIRRSLGRNWKKIKIEYQAKIVQLIKQLVVRAYIDAMNHKSKPEIECSKAEFISDKRAEVSTTVYFDNKPIVLVYRLGLVFDKWEIFDIVIEEISIVVTYRKQFDSFFAKNSSKALIEKLENLLTNENLGKSLPLY